MNIRSVKSSNISKSECSISYLLSIVLNLPLYQHKYSLSKFNIQMDPGILRHSDVKAVLAGDGVCGVAGITLLTPLVVPRWCRCRAARPRHSAAPAQRTGRSSGVPAHWLIARHMEQSGAALREISHCPSRGLLLLLIVNLNTLHKNNICQSIWYP